MPRNCVFLNRTMVKNKNSFTLKRLNTSSKLTFLRPLVGLKLQEKLLSSCSTDHMSVGQCGPGPLTLNYTAVCAMKLILWSERNLVVTDVFI